MPSFAHPSPAPVRRAARGSHHDRPTPGKLLLAILSLAVFAAGCDAGSLEMIGIAPNGSALEVSPSEVDLDNHTSIHLNARTVYPDGRSTAAGAATRWTSSDPRTATVDAAGRVTARLPGSVLITAEERGRSASSRIRILRTQADLRLVLDPEIVVEAGAVGEAPLEIRVEDVVSAPVRGVPVDVRFQAPDGSWQTVRQVTDAQGRAMAAIPVGTTARDHPVQVTSPGLPEGGTGSFGGAAASSSRDPLRGSATVRVRPSAPQTVTLSPSQNTLAVGDSLRLEASVHDSYGNEVEDATLTWSASPSAVVSLGLGGWVRGVGEGAAKIGVEARGKGNARIRAEADVEVRSERALSAVAGGGQAVPLGETAPRALEVRLRSASGDAVPGVTIAWSVVEGEATVSSGASLTDVTGTASVTIRMGSRAGNVRVRAATAGAHPVEFALTAVSPAPPEGESDGIPLQVTDLAFAGAAGTSVTLRFTEVDNGAGGPADYHVRYRAGATFGDWGTATVVSEGSCRNPVRGASVGAVRSCTVEGLSPGQIHAFQLVSMRTTTEGIRYSALSNIVGGSTTSASGAGVPVSIHLAPGSQRLTYAGQVAQLQVSARDVQGNTAPTPSVTWASSNPSIASVDAMGRVTARAAGLAVITAAAVCCTDGSAQIEVLFSDVGDTPPAQAWPNQPNGLRQIAYNDWTALPGDWGDDRWGLSLVGAGDPAKGSGRISGGSALEGFYPQGHEGGYGATRAGYRIGTPPRELFIGMVTRVDAHFVNHPFQLKWHYARMDDGSFLWIDWRDNPNDSPAVSNLGMRFQGNWVPRSHWVNTELVRQNVPRFTAPNYKPFPKGPWVRLELYMKMQDPGQNNGIIRLYQDGDLILELTDHFFPGNGFRYVYHEGTYGGGPNPVPHDQSWYVAETYISGR